MSDTTRRTLLKHAVLGAATLPFLAARAHAATHTVTIQNFAFSPAELTVAAGDTVVFVNADGAPHTATADSGAWDTGRLDNGASAEVTFPAAGAHPYFCAIHTHMRGTIIVT